MTYFVFICSLLIFIYMYLCFYKIVISSYIQSYVLISLPT